MKTIIATENAPKAIGPYSQATAHNSLIYCSGQIPIDPATGNIVDGDISVQTERVMQNLKNLLEASGSSLSAVLKTTVFIVDMNEFAAMNAVYGQFFTQNPPARSTVQVSRLPKDVRVEIDCIAIAG